MGHKLLLADDSPTIQKVVKIIFSDELYDLAIVDNGNEALDRAREAVPAVMMIDAQMPGKSGYDLCRDVRNDPLLSAVPILLLTGVFEPFDEAKARESGADDFIAKPFESEILIDKVNRLITLNASRSPALSGAAPPPLKESVRESLVAVEVTTSSPPAVARGKEELLAFEEVTALDDLWSMNSLEAHEELPFGAVGAQQEEEFLEEIEPFFVDEEPPMQSISPPVVVPAEPATRRVPIIEEPETFVFADEPELSLPLSIIKPGDVTLEELFFDVDEDEIPAPTDGPRAAITPARPKDAVEPVLALFQEMAAGPPSVATIPPSEEQLMAALSKISRDVIERIVREVVPDLAEKLIREEIRNIRKGA